MKRSKRAVRGGAGVAALARWIACGLLGLAGCGPSGAPEGHAAQIMVDGEPRLELARSALAEPLDLFAALGLEPQQAVWVEIRGDGERVLKVKSPAERYEKRILAAFPTDAGVGVGWVDPVMGALPARIDGPPAVAFAHADVVDVRVTRIDEARADRIAGAPLRIETSAGEVFELASSALAALPGRTPREVLGLGDGAEHQVMTFLGEALGASVPLADVESVAVFSAAGEMVEVDAACLVQPAPRAAMLKVNRRGEWRFKVYEHSGAGMATSANLRGLTRIEVRLRGR